MSPKHHPLPHKPQLEASSSRACGFGTRLWATFGDRAPWAGMGLAPAPGREQRERGRRNESPVEPREGCWAWRVWGERVHYILGKSESTMAHRPCRLRNRWWCFGWRGRQVLRQLPEIKELQPAELKRVQRVIRRNTFTWRIGEEGLWNWTGILEAATCSLLLEGKEIRWHWAALGSHGNGVNCWEFVTLSGLRQHAYHLLLLMFSIPIYHSKKQCAVWEK